MLNKKMLLILFLLVVSSNLNSVFCQTVSSTYTLSEKTTTSAGIYKSDGTLVRTLWSGVIKEAGTYPIVWDGTDDKLQPLPADNYTFKLLSNNVQHVWEGVIGNTTFPFKQHRENIHTTYEPMGKMVVVGNRAYFTHGYVEGGAPVSAFNLDNIQVKQEPFKNVGSWVFGQQIATDGTNLYVTIWDAYNRENTYLIGLKISDSSRLNFSGGVSYTGGHGEQWPNVVNLKTNTMVCTGLAVSSNYIFMAYKGNNTIDVLNKSTGAFVRTISITSPTSIAVEGSTLLITTNNTSVHKYNINGDGTLTASSLILSGFSDVVDVKVNGTTITVVDGGASQQVKAFSTSNGSSLWTLGQQGGIKNSPLVTDDKFGFWYINDYGLKENRGGIAFQADGSFWILDPSNIRMQHYNTSRIAVEKIMYMPHVRTVSIVGGDNKRILGNGVEYEIDYTKPIEQGWKLKYNWEGNINGNFIYEDWIKWANVLSNGKTYAMLNRNTGNPHQNGGSGTQIVELSPTQGMRNTKSWVMNNMGQGAKMYPDGSIIAFAGSAPNETQEWNKMTLTGFDSDGDPIYTYAKLKRPDGITNVGLGHSNIAGDPRISGPRPFPYEVTSSGLLALFNSNNVDDAGIDEGFHLGAMRVSDGKMMFKTSLATFKEYRGEFPTNGDYDIGNGVGYAGSVAMAIDKNIIWGYNGEFWRGQTNKFNHFYDNGLLVGHFGITGEEFLSDPINFPMMAGNNYMPQITKVGSDYYIYHTDESVRGGLHRWKITNMNSLKEQSIALTNSFVKSGEIERPAGVIDLMLGLPYKGQLKTDIAGWTITRADNEEWHANTNLLTYGKRKNPDLYIVYNCRTTTPNVSRSLGTNNNLTTWQLNGNIAYNGTNPNYWNGDGTNAYFDVLDNFGKIILRVNTINNINHTTVYYQANNQTLFQLGQQQMQNFLKILRPLDIKKMGGTITVTFNGIYSVNITTPFEAGANLSNPTTMRMYFTNGNASSDAKQIGLDGFKFSAINSTNTPTSPTLLTDDAANTLIASHTLGTTEILVSENGAAYVAYTGQINVGNIARAAGYWKFKTKAATLRNESAVVNSSAFTEVVTPNAPTLAADDAANTLIASHALSTTEILVSENGAAYVAYTGQINVGNIARAAGYWKFKTKAATLRNESAVVNSPAFTVAAVATTPTTPTLATDDAANTLIASHALGTTEILVSENGAAYVAYTGQINVGNIARAAGYWKFKTKAATLRNESAVVSSPLFSIEIANITPASPSVYANDTNNTLDASHTLGGGEIVYSVNNGPYSQWPSSIINIGNVALPAGYYKFKMRSATGRNESVVVNSPAFTVAAVATTPTAPTLAADDAANTLIASHALGTTEILVSENGAAYVAYTGQINVGNIARAAGYWKFKTKAATLRNESAVVNSPAFTEVVTPNAPNLVANDTANTLMASHTLGTTEILVSENGAAYVSYTGQINVGNIARAAGYWKFKTRAATLRNESAVVNSPAFTEVVTPNAPTLVANDTANTLMASHTLGTTEILVSENGAAYVAYTGQINVGNIARAAGYWKFKTKAATLRNESAVVNSPAFTIGAVATTPTAPTLAADDAANTLIASHALSTTEILVSENGAAYVSYTGQINVGNIARAAGYWKFKTRAATLRNESVVVNSPAFTELVTPNAPTLVANDTANTLMASHTLGTTEIMVSENDAAYTTYTGQINVGNIARAAGYWKFKTKAATLRNESAVVNSPAFTEVVTPNAPTLVADDVTNILIASHTLGTTEILVSENGAAYTSYTGQINVGNSARAAGYWKFKTKAATLRNESAVVNSPAFTEVVTPNAPTLVADDITNTLIASDTLGTTEILVSENGAAYTSYTGQINVGNIARAAGYWKFKTKAATLRNESAVVNSPAFTEVVTPNAPTLVADDVTNTLIASHTLGMTEILVSENDGIFTAYTGTINIGNVEKPAGYWKFKTKAETLRNESAVISSPAFTSSTTPDAPLLAANDASNKLSASHSLGSTEILVSENGGMFIPYTGQINVGDVARASGYWRFKVRAALQRNESSIAMSPAFTSKRLDQANFPRPADITNTMTISSSPTLRPLQFTGTDLTPDTNEADKNASFQVYPNPIVTSNIFIKSNNVPKGQYVLSLVNNIGQTISKEFINHEGGILNKSIPLTPDMSKGVYILYFSGNKIKFAKQLLK